MTDRELLEAAARAAGITAPWSEKANAYRWSEGSEWVEWNPLNNPADALKLVIDLALLVAVFPHEKFTKNHVEVCVTSDNRLSIDISEVTTGDPYAATRRAIVRAAAEIGSLHNAMYGAKSAL